MTNDTFHSAPAASNAAGAGSGFSPSPLPSQGPPPPFQTMAPAAQNPAPNTAVDLDNALLAMNNAVDAMANATTAFFQAADLVNASVAALRAPPVASTNGTIASTGPWVAGLYDVIPAEPLRAIPDNGDKWYAITRGKYVGLTRNSAVSLNAVTGISTGLAEKHNSQADALDYFNAALATDAVAVLVLVLGVRGGRVSVMWYMYLFVVYSPMHGASGAYPLFSVRIVSVNAWLRLGRLFLVSSHSLPYLPNLAQIPHCNHRTINRYQASRVARGRLGSGSNDNNHLSPGTLPPLVLSNMDEAEDDADLARLATLLANVSLSGDASRDRHRARTPPPRYTRTAPSTSRVPPPASPILSSVPSTPSRPARNTAGPASRTHVPPLASPISTRTPLMPRRPARNVTVPASPTSRVPPPASPISNSVPSTPRRDRLYVVHTPERISVTSHWSEAASQTQGIAGCRPVLLTKKNKKKSRTPKGGYAVFRGRQPGAYPDWNTAEQHVRGASGAVCQGYPTFDGAQAAYDYAFSRSWTRVCTSRPASPGLTTSAAIPALPTSADLEQRNPLHGYAEGDNDKQKWYVVYAGIDPGVYQSYIECALNTVGLSNAAFDSADDKDTAVAMYTFAVEHGDIRVLRHRYLP
ncbi:hypothetical protein DFH06DRAFT_1124936 [Mycena polygramma]|nr:hypothetical protein DFH06DRAFT_1124936 [Mycena polygramma]